MGKKPSFFVRFKFAWIIAATALLTAGITALLVNIFEHKQEERQRFVRLVEVAEFEPDPAVWAKNFPREYDAYMKTVRTAEMAPYSKYGRYGGSESFSKLDKHPDYKRLFAGYSFSVEYNEERGHMNALTDVIKIKRLGDNKPATCISCKTSHVPGLMEKLGPEKFYSGTMKQLIADHDIKHPISCADCHKPDTMELRVTRPAFKEAMQRRGIDLTKATRQEMRTYVCAQCHVEYYFKKPGNYLAYPWDKGLKIENIEDYYEELHFKDWEHEETKTPMIKMQHPEYELWSTGIHARSGVSCADCHMPYTREGAVKITDHWIRSPLMNVSKACLTCHRQSEEEMKSRVLEIQDKTYAQMEHAEKALVSAMDELKDSMAAGASDGKLEEARHLLRRAQMRWDFISAENSMGFHSPQESARILGDATDFARQAQISAIKARK